MAIARKCLRRRVDIEPIISHLKSDYRQRRNFLKGFTVVQINLLMLAAAFNFKSWMRVIILWLNNLKVQLSALIEYQRLFQPVCNHSLESSHAHLVFSIVSHEVGE